MDFRNRFRALTYRSSPLLGHGSLELVCNLNALEQGLNSERGSDLREESCYMVPGLELVYR